MAKAEDMGNFYRIPADNRNLNYNQYFLEGKSILPEVEDYNSHNTKRLTIEDVKSILMQLDVFKI
jgi:UDP-glucose 4-epimerase